MDFVQIKEALQSMAVEHKQAPITHEGEVIFEVDQKLQSLIQFFVDHDIFTWNSCQDNVRGTVWIEYDLLSWMEIVAAAFKDEARELHEFIEENCEVLLLSCDDGRLDENDEYWIEGDELLWSASVRFSKKLLPQFERCVRDVIGKASPLAAMH